jgi:hypothetical protein
MVYNPLDWSSLHWSIFGVVLVLILLRRGKEVYNHPANVLCRQATNMNWFYSRKIKDENGYKNICLQRDGMEAMISYKEGNVYMVVPSWGTPLKDFVEVEDWIASLHDLEIDDGREAKSEVEGGEEVKLVLSAFLIEEKKIEKSGSISYLTALKLIRSHVLDMISDEDATAYEIRESKMAPKNLVYVIMTNAIEAPLANGTYHTYRGTLGFQGTYLLSLWDYAIGQMENSGFYTPEKAKEEKQWIRSRIKEVG